MFWRLKTGAKDIDSKGLKAQSNRQITYRGHVKWFDSYKGYGFISREDGGKDCFVHQTGVVGPFFYLRDGEEVEFEIENTTKGTRAINVRSVRNESKA